MDFIQPIFTREQMIAQICKANVQHELVSNHMQELKDILKMDNNELRHKLLEDLYDMAFNEAKPKILKEIEIMDKGNKHLHLYKDQES